MGVAKEKSEDAGHEGVDKGETAGSGGENLCFRLNITRGHEFVAAVGDYLSE